ncbi:MAG TPA: GYD domain-containing protein [Luteimonas sp.]|jgi:uncharacterized protein with GYD domain|nr:GYD domain-containing protein [Luteimonas sp.]
MPTYISLCRFTDQGIRTIKDTTKRAAAVQEAAQKFGAAMSQLYWTLGHYDLITIVDAEDEQAATAFMLSIASAGNVRVQTLRAFNRDEMGRILDRM